jgi:hypothetical protein
LREILTSPEIDQILTSPEIDQISPEIDQILTSPEINIQIIFLYIRKLIASF